MNPLTACTLRRLRLHSGWDALHLHPVRTPIASQAESSTLRLRQQALDAHKPLAVLVPMLSSESSAHTVGLSEVACSSSARQLVHTALHWLRNPPCLLWTIQTLPPAECTWHPPDPACHWIPRLVACDLGSRAHGCRIARGLNCRWCSQA